MGFFGGGGGAAGVGGSTGSTDNAILRADGTAGATLQNSALVVGDAISGFSCTGVASTDVITAVGHNFTTNQSVRFQALTGGSGLNTSTTYFVRDISEDTFKVSTTSGGSAVNFTTDITAGTIVAGQAQLVISNNASDTNSSFAVNSKGNGAFMLGSGADGISAGGNPRGQNAVDLQKNRDSAAQVASGNNSFVAGSNNTASGDASAVIGGGYGTASNNGSAVIGGFASTANNVYSVAFGRYSLANRHGMIAHQSREFSTQDGGGAQHCWFVVSRKVSDETPSELFLELASNRLTIASGRTMACIINVCATSSGGEFANQYIRQFIIANRSGTTALRGSVQTVGTDIEGIAGADLVVEADDTNDAIAIKFSGVARVTGCTIAAATDVISKTAHGFSNNDDIVFTSLTGGAGLTLNTVTYWVIDATADTFKVSATRGGAAVNITTDYTDATAARLFRVVASVDAVEIAQGT